MIEKDINEKNFDVSSIVWKNSSDGIWDEYEIESFPSDTEARIRKRNSRSEYIICGKHLLIAKNPQATEDMDDLTMLQFLDEPNIVRSLETRFQSSKIYTFTGTILIAMNPWSTNLKDSGFYSQKKMIEYSSVPGNSTPHVFAIANSAFQSMRLHRTSQSILVSGESGSGKTETSKHLMAHISSLSRDASFNSAPQTPPTAALCCNPSSPAFDPPLPFALT